MEDPDYDRRAPPLAAHQRSKSAPSLSPKAGKKKSDCYSFLHDAQNGIFRYEDRKGRNRKDKKLGGVLLAIK